MNFFSEKNEKKSLIFLKNKNSNIAPINSPIADWAKNSICLKVNDVKSSKICFVIKKHIKNFGFIFGEKNFSVFTSIFRFI